MPGKAPTQGQKVTLGQNAPMTREGTGVVQPDSLAAKSYREGSGFAENRNAGPSDGTSAFAAGKNTSSAERQDKDDGGDGDDRQGAQAPTYVSSVYQRERAGPHGRNLKERGFEGEGPGKSILAEPGSEEDPARLAEREGREGRAKVPGTGRGAVETEQPYEALEPETTA